MDSSAPNSGMDRMDGFAKKAFGAVSGVASTACGYAKQLPSSSINGMDCLGKAFGAVSGVSSTAWGYAKHLPISSDINGKAFGAVSGVASAACGYAKQLPRKAFGAVSGVSSTAWGYAKQLPSSHINGKAFDAVSGVSSAACGYAKQLSNLATDQLQSSQITDFINLYGMCTGLGVNATTVGAVATVGVAALGVYMLVGSPGKEDDDEKSWEGLGNSLTRLSLETTQYFAKLYLIETHLLKARL
nr:cytochrome P450 CYP749A22-like [Ipomoea batatas]